MSFREMTYSAHLKMLMFRKSHSAWSWLTAGGEEPPTPALAAVEAWSCATEAHAKASLCPLAPKLGEFWNRVEARSQF